jgi:hypothetical protein
MVENNKMKIVEEHCRRFENRLQGLHQKFQESLVDQQSKWKEQCVGQNKRANQINS